MDNNICYVQTMEYYSASSTEENLPFSTTWMNLENGMFNEISQAQEDKYHIIPFLGGI